MTRHSLITVAIACVVLVLAVSATHAGCLITIIATAAFLKCAMISGHGDAPTSRTAAFQFVAFSGVAVYFIWGAFVLSGNASMWPRGLPLLDTFVLTVHEILNSRFDTPFGNPKTLAAVGTVVVSAASRAGWMLGRSLINSPQQAYLTDLQNRYYKHLPILAGSCFGLLIGLVAAMFTDLKRSPLPLTFIVSGTFVGAWLARKRSLDKEKQRPTRPGDAMSS